MDISKITTFINYIPVLEKEPKQLLIDILDESDLSQTDKQALIDTYEFANMYHAKDRRLSGELYIIHPIKVLEFLMMVQPDLASMQAAILHDLIEDTIVTYDQIEKAFNKEVADLCDGLVKVSKVRYSGEDRQIETLKKTFLAMGKDLRVIIVKLADRVHNIQTLHYHPRKEKRQRIAEETIKIYVPIAKRLGLYVFQGYLENGAFYQLEPREYNRIFRYVSKEYGDVDAYKDNGIQRLELLCESDEVPYVAVVGRLKSPYRIHRKLKKNQNDIARIMDILAFRIITDSVSHCYTILGLIHKHYTPIFSKMKDYIAIPKPNGYKSLHTTVLGMFDFPVEIQVRTKEMDDVANYGVAAHFAYAEHESSVNVSKEQSQWINSLQDIVKKYQENPDKESFKHELDIEILQKNIFVYTPNGDIIELPQKSTVLDFAFRVHTDIGLKFKNGFVNQKIVPIDYRVKTGDIVSISTFKSKFTANEGRLRFLHTPTAKTKITRRLRQKEKDQLFKTLGEKINKKLESLNLPALGTKQDLVTKKFHGKERERVLYKIRDRQMSVTKLIKESYPNLVELHELPLHAPPTAPITPIDKFNNQIFVDGNFLQNVIYCPECKPTSSNKIIARSGADGIKIHTLECEALDTINAKKLLEAHRTGQHRATYTLELDIDALDRPGMLIEVLKIFENLGLNVLRLTTGDSDKEGYAMIYVSLIFDHPSKVGFVFDELKPKRNILKIINKRII